MVSLTLLKPEWACLPRYVSRLVRDAFAAMQVGHPNLVRLDEFGEDHGRIVFASEFVDGTTLARRIDQQGKFTPREAVALVLQAARGLRFSHGQGLTHGDVQPDNILVDQEGVTRLAGLGLSRTPESVAAEEARKAGPIPLGDPRQAEVAAAVRTDIRGLGRTLEHLLTGQPSGRDGSVGDATGLIARGVPVNLVEILANMLKAPPGLGYDDLGQVITTLERFLEARKPGTTRPGEEHTRILTECLVSFRASSAARLRSRIVSGGAAACALLVFVTLLARQPVVAGGFLALGLMTALAYFVITGLSRGSDLFTKVRRLVLESRAGDWLTGLAVLVLAISALVVFGLHWAWLAFGTLGVILAAALHFDIDRKVEAERHGAVEQTKAMLKDLRLRGVGEETLRRFVRATAGDRWEEFFEAIFGSEAMRSAREPAERGLKGTIRKWSLPLRDWLISWVEARLEARRQERELVLLQVIEERGLVAEGVNLATARRKARRIAEAMVAVAAEIRAAERTAAPSSEDEAAARPTIAGAIRDAAETPEHVLVEREPGLIGPDTSRVWDLLLGPRARFLLGTVLLVGCLCWVHQNGIVSGEQIKDVAARAITGPDPLRTLRDARLDVHLHRQTRPLRLPFLPGLVTNQFRSFNPGVAGLILILSAMVGGTRAGLLAIAGAAVAWIGPSVGVPRLGSLDSQTASMVLGAGISMLVIFLGRHRATMS
jgi:hypothetical protein